MSHSKLKNKFIRKLSSNFADLELFWVKKKQVSHLVFIGKNFQILG
jgi:hypothetical protein